MSNVVGRPAVVGKQARAEQTRTAIIDAALALFSERGFDATTMRAIAEQAGVSLGSAYYYFDSKEQLIQGFYDQTAVVFGRELPGHLDGVTAFGERLGIHLDLWFRLMAPHHPFAVAFFRNAADPASPLSPFSAESGPTREAAIEMMRQVIDGKWLLWLSGLLAVGLGVWFLFNTSAGAVANAGVAEAHGLQATPVESFFTA